MSVKHRFNHGYSSIQEFTSPADEFRKAGHEVITIEKQQAGKTVKGKKEKPAWSSINPSMK